MKLVKFGHIREDENGCIVFQNFHVDVGHLTEEIDIEPVLMRLSIERLQKELEIFESVPPSSTDDATPTRIE